MKKKFLSNSPTEPISRYEELACRADAILNWKNPSPPRLSLVPFCTGMSLAQVLGTPDIPETSETIIPEIEGKRSLGIGFRPLSISPLCATHTQNR
ncbi:hypothetical protein AVEN_155215-1 [Araneus ventricosus]|uniref:Uncharacterized protein n=1 Tax=Araneus ventricosus TaxID=182803 RepID=A0A4Y2ELR5_ARAVE|nr:hypothetical protein AVEN_155215-1 [Araneus ventricosus]